MIIIKTIPIIKKFNASDATNENSYADNEDDVNND